MSEYEQKQSKNIKENELEMLKMGFVSTQTADFRDIYFDVLGTPFNYGVEMHFFLPYMLVQCSGKRNLSHNCFYYHIGNK